MAPVERVAPDEVAVGLGDRDLVEFNLDAVAVALTPVNVDASRAG